MNQALVLSDSDFTILLIFAVGILVGCFFCWLSYLAYLDTLNTWQAYMNITSIPPKKQDAGDPPKKFLTQVKTSEYLALQKEAADRGMDILSLTGCVLSVWLASGCPLVFQVDGQADQQL